jgi:hypothetical protein
MKNVVVRLDKSLGASKAREYFMEICGLYRRGDINPRLLEESLEVFQEVYDRIEIMAIFSKFDNSCLRDGELNFDGLVFSCPALFQVNKDDVLEVVAYLLTIGDVEITGERITLQIYQDAWQTAFVDAGRDLLKNHIKSVVTKEAGGVSDTFGPGFFGMPATDTEKFFRLLSADKIGANVRPSGLMHPVKSYVGFFLASRGELSLLNKDCKNCISSGRTCSYCKTGRQSRAAFEAELNMEKEEKRGV